MIVGSPSQCHRGCLEALGHGVEHVRLQRSESTQREVRQVGDTLRGERVDECAILAIRDVVEVLHGDDRRDGLGFGQA